MKILTNLLYLALVTMTLSMVTFCNVVVISLFSGILSYALYGETVFWLVVSVDRWAVLFLGAIFWTAICGAFGGGLINLIEFIEKK